jgi:hypothetical protein
MIELSYIKDRRHSRIDIHYNDFMWRINLSALRCDLRYWDEGFHIYNNLISRNQNYFIYMRYFL